MNIFLEYLVVFVVVFIFNYFVQLKNIPKKKKRGRRKKKEVISTELLYLNRIYNVDISKIDIKKFMLVVSFINTFIISSIYIIIMYLLNNIILRIIIGVVLLILMIIICYGFLAKYYLWKEGR